MPKLCVECKYYYRNYGDDVPKHVCTHPLTVKTDLVTGEKSYKNCYDLRGISSPAGEKVPCGPLGKLWEPK